MNGLDTIIRDNLKWQARAYVAARQRKDSARQAALADAAASALDAAPFRYPAGQVFNRELKAAEIERANTRGL